MPDTLNKAWHDRLPKMLVVLTALLGQYFCSTMVSTVLYGIMIAGVTVTNMPADVLVVAGEAVIVHVRIPWVISTPEKPKLVLYVNMAELVIVLRKSPVNAAVVAAYIGLVISLMTTP